MKRSRRLFWLLAVALLVLLGGGTALFFRGAGGSGEPAPGYKTAQVSRGTLERTVSSSGTLAAVETVTVGTEVSGTIDKVLVDFNSRVEKGEVLATLKPALFAAAVAEGEASVARAEADLALARRELERSRPLYDKGYLSEQEFLPIRFNVDRFRAALDQARATLERGRTNQRNATIRSPIDGTVIQRSIDAGQTVAASLNTPTLFVIARDLARMQIEADVDETDIGQIRPEQAVRFTVQSYPDRTFSGTVRQVRLQPETVQSVVTYTVIVAAANPEGVLLPGMTATVDFVVEHLEDVLLIPNAALRFTPENKESGASNGKSPRSAAETGGRVFRLGATGELQPFAVATLSSDGQMTAISDDGLQSGDAVVTGPAKEGAKVKKSFSLFGAMRGRPRK